jgi:hypothetical protein
MSFHVSICIFHLKNEWILMKFGSWEDLILIQSYVTLLSMNFKLYWIIIQKLGHDTRY